jgi:hypothetical protein
LKKQTSSLTAENKNLENMAKSTNKPHDFLDHILNHPYNQKLPFIAKIKKAVKRVEKYAGLNAS